MVTGTRLLRYPTDVPETFSTERLLIWYAMKLGRTSAAEAESYLTSGYTNRILITWFLIIWTTRASTIYICWRYTATLALVFATTHCTASMWFANFGKFYSAYASEQMDEMELRFKPLTRALHAQN